MIRVVIGLANAIIKKVLSKDILGKLSFETQRVLKHVGIKYHYLGFWYGIESWSPGPLANTLLIKPMER